MQALHLPTPLSGQTGVRMQRALFLHANELKAARDWLLERFGPPTGPTRGLGASLGGNDSPSGSPRGSPVRQQAPRGYEFRPDPSTPTSAGWPKPERKLWDAVASSRSLRVLMSPCRCSSLGRML